MDVEEPITTAPAGDSRRPKCEDGAVMIRRLLANQAERDLRLACFAGALQERLAVLRLWGRTSEGELVEEVIRAFDRCTEYRHAREVSVQGAAS